LEKGERDAMGRCAGSQKSEYSSDLLSFVPPQVRTARKNFFAKKEEWGIGKTVCKLRNPC